MNTSHVMPLALALLCTAGTAFAADDAAVLACRKLGDAGARLACYDAMPTGAAAPAQAGAPVAVHVIPARPVPTPEQNFGLEDVRRPEAPKQIDSTLAGEFEGWGPSTQFRLANGQVWKVSDGSSATLDRSSNPKVRIVRNMFGTTFIEFEGTNQSAKVRRVR